jgi:methylase of polypeptide subunit release factors
VCLREVVAHTLVRRNPQITAPAGRIVTDSDGTGQEETADFDGLTIHFDDRVLRPRPWTAEQSRWAAALLEGLDPGPVLELCAGAGQIGRASVAGSTRRLLCIDADPAAAGFATRNARTAGMTDRVEVREARLTEALAAEEEFVLILADPPWVSSTETDRFPEDPLSAIDGGGDGLDVARQCLEVIADHLAHEGVALLQLGSEAQVVALQPEIGPAGLGTSEVRNYQGGVVARLERRPHASKGM